MVPQQTGLVLVYNRPRKRLEAVPRQEAPEVSISLEWLSFPINVFKNDVLGSHTVCGPTVADAGVRLVDLGDLPCRVAPAALLRILHNVWLLALPDAEVVVRLPHPRHDLFYADFGYIRGLLPTAFASLTGNCEEYSYLAPYEDTQPVFEITSLNTQLDNYWAIAVDSGKTTVEELSVLSLQANNVIVGYELKLRVVKPEANVYVKQLALATLGLSADMMDQLEKQIAAHAARGNEVAANQVRAFIDDASLFNAGRPSRKAAA